MKIFKYIISILIIYLYIYSPALQILPIGIDKLIFVIALFFILVNRKESFRLLRFFKKDYKFLFAVFLLSLFNFIFHGGSYGTGILMYDFFLLIEPIPVAIAIYILNGQKLKTDVKIAIFLSSGLAGLITVYLLLNPGLALYIKESVLRVPEILNTYFSYRGFGFADGLLNPYPTAQGLILGLLLCGFFNVRGYYYFLSVPIFISIIVNARIGVLPVIFGLLLFLFFKTSNDRGKNILVGIAVIALTLFYFTSYTSLLSSAEESIEWGKSTITMFSNLLHGEEVENVEALTNTMLFFPEDIWGWMIGGGYNVYGNNPLHKYSDIGYIIRLHYGGTIYLLIIVLYDTYL